MHNNPKKKFGYLLGLWFFLFGLTVLGGGKGLKSGFPDYIPYCGVVYWIIKFIAFISMFVFACFMGRRAVSKSSRKQKVDYPFVQGDVVWDYPKLVFYCKWTFVAGIIAGLIGIGGGMVLGPLMLGMNVLPQVSTATTATMIVLTSSYVASLYVIGGLVPVDYAVFFFCVAFCGALLGKSQIDKVVKKYDMTSILIFILASIIAFASTMIALLGLYKYSENGWCFEGLQGVCG